MISDDDHGHLLDLTPAIDLLGSLSLNDIHFDQDGKYRGVATSDAQVTPSHSTTNNNTSLALISIRPPSPSSSPNLGTFTDLWGFLGQSPNLPPPLLLEDDKANTISLPKPINSEPLFHDDFNSNAFDFPKPVNRKERKAARRNAVKQKLREFAAKERASQEACQHHSLSSSDLETENELQNLRCSPDRRAVVNGILYDVYRPKPIFHGYGSTTSPSSASPPKDPVTPLRTKTQYPVSQLFLFNPYHASHNQILPLVQRTPKDRKARLILKLFEHHPEEQALLAYPSLMVPSLRDINVADGGVHVFVDASNIMIGFHDSLKTARNIPVSSKVRRAPFCFHNFSLILERGRPVAKRVLVGSDNFPAIQEAKDIGYETNILERVHKAKELTPRQKRFRNRNGASGSSGSETNAVVYAPEKWVEQAVDEILHLKILESVVDATKPSTIVLATGDAAEAEYSAGFMSMVERALKKGWKIELVSFRLNTSGAYRRKDFRSRWGSMFKIIELDDYVEEILDM
ncbi:MAG: hypothetical protein M1834_008691 [Cirrosporium novae-zelandiae]|nr:MAG: hypothetical protein M1834_008691 [Cirrosporium novae-zelandiae]